MAKYPNDSVYSCKNYDCRECNENSCQNCDCRDCSEDSCKNCDHKKDCKQEYKIHFNDEFSIECCGDFVKQRFVLSTILRNNVSVIYNSTKFQTKVKNAQTFISQNQCIEGFPSGRVIARNLSSNTSISYTVIGGSGQVTTIEVGAKSEAVILAQDISRVEAFSVRSKDPARVLFIFDIINPINEV